MLNHYIMKSCTIITIVAFLFTLFFSPFDTNAQWHSKRNELPGLTKDGVTILVVVLVVLAVLIIIRIADNSQEKNHLEQESAPSARSWISIYNPELAPTSADSLFNDLLSAQKNLLSPCFWA